MTFLGFILIPAIIVLVAFKISDQIDWRKLLIMLGILLVFSGASMAICYYGNTRDVETWNGVISSKKREEVSCSHSYKCHCYQSCTGSGKDQRCTEVCSTCYDHSYDVDWHASTSNGERINVPREDRQGLTMPHRWSAISVGEPTAIPHSFVNLIKGAPGTLFRKTGQEGKFALPSYPKVYDYYRMDRLIADHGTVPDPIHWNAELSAINARVGSRKQVNAMVVITRQPREFFYALEQSWIGGKKNDAILVIGVGSDLKPIWTEVMAWVLDETFRVKLKDEALNLPKVERDSVLPLFERNIMELYQRKPMHDFAYLKASIVPTTTQWVVVVLLGILMTVGMVYLAINYDSLRGFRSYQRNYGSSYYRRRI